MNGIPCSRFLYSATTSLIFFTILLWKADRCYKKPSITAQEVAVRPLQEVCCTMGGT
jgi:hypothetical protein